MSVEIVVKFEKAFRGFAERAITTNNNDRLDTISQRSARLPRRIPRRICFVSLILNAGRVELFLNGGPQAPRTRSAVVDDDPCFDPCNLWLNFLPTSPSATGSLGKFPRAWHRINGPPDLRIAVIENLRRRAVTVGR